MNCHAARHLFGGYWDDELTRAERERLEAHFMACPACRVSYEDLTRTLDALGSLPRPDVSVEFADRVLARTRLALPAPEETRSRSARLVPVTAAAGMLAVLAVVAIRWNGSLVARNPATTAEVQQPRLVDAEAPRVSPGAPVPQPAAGAGLLAGGLRFDPDSLFADGEDVEFILDPVTLRKGRATTVMPPAQETPRGQQAVITF